MTNVFIDTFDVDGENLLFINLKKVLFNTGTNITRNENRVTESPPIFSTRFAETAALECDRLGRIVTDRVRLTTKVLPHFILWFVLIFLVLVPCVR